MTSIGSFRTNYGHGNPMMFKSTLRNLIINSINIGNTNIALLINSQYDTANILANMTPLSRNTITAAGFNWMSLRHDVVNHNKDIIDTITSTIDLPTNIQTNAGIAID